MICRPHDLKIAEITLGRTARQGSSGGKSRADKSPASLPLSAAASQTTRCLLPHEREDLGKSLLAKAHALARAVIHHKARHAHHVVALTQCREAVHVVDIGCDQRVIRRHALAGHHHVRTHGARETHQHAQAHRARYASDALAVCVGDGLAGTRSVVEAKHEGRELVAAGKEL